jgi:hypothetical protein
VITLPYAKFNKQGIETLLNRLKHNRVSIERLCENFLGISPYKWRKYMNTKEDNYLFPRYVMNKLMYIYGASYDEMYQAPYRKVVVMPFLVKQNPVVYDPLNYTFIESGIVDSKFKYDVLHNYLSQLENDNVNISRYCHYTLGKSPSYVRQSSMGLKMPSMDFIWNLAAVTHTKLSTWLHDVKMDEAAATDCFPQEKCYYDEFYTTGEVASTYGKEGRNLKTMIKVTDCISYVIDEYYMLIPKYELDNLNEWIVENTDWRRIDVSR